MKLIMILVSLSSLVIMNFYLGITFDTRIKKMLDELIEMSELIKELEREAKEMSSISATMYGQKLQEVKENVDTDAEQAEDSEQ